MTKIYLKCGKEVSSSMRLLRNKDLLDMGLDSVPGQIYLEVATSDKPINSKNFKEDMVNIIFPQISDPLRQIRLCKENGADLVVSVGTKNENVNQARERLKILKDESQDNRDNLFVIDYAADDGVIFAIKEFSEYVDFVGMHVGTYIYGCKAFKRVAQKLNYLRQLLNKPIILFGVPLKVQGDHQKDIRFFPFYHLVAEGWALPWKPVPIKSETVRIVDNKDYRCKTYQEFLGSGYLPGDKLRLSDRTIYDSFHHTSYNERKKYEHIILDEELNKLYDLEEVQKTVFAKVHPNYIGEILLCWRIKMLQDIVVEASTINPRINRLELQGTIYQIGPSSGPFEVDMAARKALEWMKEQIENQQFPVAEDFIKKFADELSKLANEF